MAYFGCFLALFDHFWLLLVGKLSKEISDWIPDLLSSPEHSETQPSIPKFVRYKLNQTCFSKILLDIFEKNIIVDWLVGYLDNPINTIIRNSSDVFTNLFHYFFPLIFLSLSSWRWKQTSYWSETFFFSVCFLKKKS